MRGSTRRSIAASGTRRDSIPTTCARSRTSRRRCRSSPSAICATRRRGCRRSATTSASPTARSITFTARPARPAGRRRSRSAAATGTRSPTRTRASSGAWACGRATPCSSRRSSASTWARGARSPASSACARKAFPFGAGAPGMTARAAMWLDLMKPSAFYSTPSFALHLAEVARAEGFDPRTFGLKTMFFSGEPGASVPGVRDRIVAAYGARVIDCGSMAEMTPFMNIAGTAETDGMLLLAGRRLHRGLRSRRRSGACRYGERGTPVYTHLERTSQPMIRLVSGDLTLWEDGPTPCGRTYPRLPQGIFGRIDDMFTIRGENVYPSEVDAAVNELAGYGGEHRIVITRDGAMDELLIRVEAAPAVHAAGAAALARARRRGRAEAPADAGAARQGRSRRAGNVSADRFQGAARHRRPRRVPRDERAARGRARDGQRARRSISSPACWPAKSRAIARLLTRAEAGDDEVPAGAGGDLPARRPRARRRHHRRAGQRQVDAGREARRRNPPHRAPRRHRRDRPVVPVLRRRDSRRPHPDGRAWPAIPASTCAAWPRAARSAGSRAARWTRSTSSMRRVTTSSSSRRSAWARTRSRSCAPRTRRSSSRRRAWATTSRRSRPASSRSPTSTS